MPIYYPPTREDMEAWLQASDRMARRWLPQLFGVTLNKNDFSYTLRALVRSSDRADADRAMSLNGYVWQADLRLTDEVCYIALKEVDPQAAAALDLRVELQAFADEHGIRAVLDMANVLYSEYVQQGGIARQAI